MPNKTWSEWTGEEARAVSDSIKHASENRLVQEAVGVAAVGIATALAVGTRGKWAGAAERLFPEASELLESELGLVPALKEVGVSGVEKPVGTIVSEAAASKLSGGVEKITDAPIVRTDDFVNSVRANLFESAQIQPVGSIEKDFTLRKVAAIDSWPGLKSVDVSDGKALIHPDANIESLKPIKDGAIIGLHTKVTGIAPNAARRADRLLWQPNQPSRGVGLSDEQAAQYLEPITSENEISAEQLRNVQEHVKPGSATFPLSYEGKPYITITPKDVRPAAEPLGLTAFDQRNYRFVPARSLLNDIREGNGPVLRGVEGPSRLVFGDDNAVQHILCSNTATDDERADLILIGGYAGLIHKDVLAIEAASKVESQSIGFISYPIERWASPSEMQETASEGSRAYVEGNTAAANNYTTYLTERFGPFTPELRTWGRHIMSDPIPESSWPPLDAKTETLIKGTVKK